MADRPKYWRKSRQCESHQCVEVAIGADRVTIRDSTSPNGPFIEVSARAWESFCAVLRAGGFGR